MDCDRAALMDHDRRRWLVLYVECFGVLMVSLDATIVNVALASIAMGLGFSDRSLPWVVNSYLIPYGGFLLLGARLGDYYGGRRAFLSGVAVFTAASLACGLSSSQAMLVGARALQGLAAAVVMGVGFSLTLQQFEDRAERAKAVGVFSFACACGGSAGLLFGGVITQLIGWRWIFFVNVPAGVIVLVLCSMGLTRTAKPCRPRNSAAVSAVRTSSDRLDVAGGLSVTGALLLATYAALRVPELGLSSVDVQYAVAGALALLLGFITIEARVRAPLIPLSFFLDRNFAVAVVAGGLWAGAQSAWFYLCTLYLRRVLGYDALAVGLAFLPVNLIISILSCGPSARFVTHVGIRLAFSIGMATSGLGFLLFSRAPVNAVFTIDVLPGLLLISLGNAIGFNALALGAAGHGRHAGYGAVSGVLNTSLIMAGPLAIAFFSGLSTTRASELLKTSATLPTALNSGYHVSFFVGAMLAGLAALLGTLWRVTPDAHEAQAPGPEGMLTP